MANSKTQETIYSSSMALTPGLQHNDAITVRSGKTPAKEGARRVINPQEEYRYWESQYEASDEVALHLNFDHTHGPAYRYGIETFARQEGIPFDEIDEKTLASAWENMQEKSALSWDEAKGAVRKAYERLYQKDS